MLHAACVEQSSSAQQNNKVQTHSLDPGLTGLWFSWLTAWINTEAITTDFRLKIPSMPFTRAVATAAAADWL